MALHEQCVGATDEWYTPPEVFEALGVTFDLDVASPGWMKTPWLPARAFLTANGLEIDWAGFVWMNAPFGGRNGLTPWLEKFTQHGHGIALVPDRTSAPWWQMYAPNMDLILFWHRKIQFVGTDGKRGKSPAQGTCLFGLGERATVPLKRAQDAGRGILMKPVRS